MPEQDPFDSLVVTGEPDMELRRMVVGLLRPFLGFRKTWICRVDIVPTAEFAGISAASRDALMRLAQAALDSWATGRDAEWLPEAYKDALDVVTVDPSIVKMRCERCRRVLRIAPKGTEPPLDWCAACRSRWWRDD